MKKLLGIMVLGLLVCNSAYAAKAKIKSSSEDYAIYFFGWKNPAYILYEPTETN